MEKVNITLVFYIEIKDSVLYGGNGKIGYAEQRMDLEKSDLGGVQLIEVAESAVKGFSALCKVPSENVRIISRKEYEDNVGTDGVDNPDLCISIT